MAAASKSRSQRANPVRKLKGAGISRLWAQTHRQSLAVAASAHAREDQAFIDAVLDRGDER